MVVKQISTSFTRKKEIFVLKRQKYLDQKIKDKNMTDGKIWVLKKIKNNIRANINIGEVKQNNN